MKRFNIYLSKDSIKFLKSRKGTVSEHIRWAVENYINQIKKEETRVSASASIKEVD